MFDNFKIANYSNSLVSPELYARHFSRLIAGNVIDGLTLVPKTGLTVTLQSGNALISYGSGATASARMVSLVADFDITLSTADASNPRIDSIVCYVDTTVSLPSGTPTSANLDGPGVWKAVKVNGTPNASPVAPNSTAIQAAIGAGKPYFVAHDVRVDAGVTTIAANKITDRRTLAMVSLATALAASLPENSIGAAALSTSAITLGYAQITTDFNTTSTGTVDITGLSVTVTVPPGGRRVKVTSFIPWIEHTAANANMVISILDGAAGISGTHGNFAGANLRNSRTTIAVHTPSAGSHTYKVSTSSSGTGGTTKIAAGATYPAFILVEMI
ncbi:hypothetical protein RR21198_4010 [Rhodococcus rhodochrous ATCC 21198]|uniref:hypothetical protein n=1 Tax=Rhodococcus aetherivorans TaxID=191292 RepID=UPI0003E27103|nr:hypothetical protein [Rhodococcus aetherivorans]ETT25270.1 hypothetical protein RR21198_4010 [Rhodococcus rhodochrous ATCC 21198]NGP28457.1 hypothetical protein [Rhodococcus aetherivorans]